MADVPLTRHESIEEIIKKSDTSVIISLSFLERKWNLCYLGLAIPPSNFEPNKNTGRGENEPIRIVFAGHGS